MATLKLDLLVDREKNRVVLAESGSDFVDILLSLTLPIGTIVRLLGKQSSVGCFDKLYQSVENLDTKFFEREAYKSLLIQLRNAAVAECEKLKINIDDSKTEIYACDSNHYPAEYSLIPGLFCPSCGMQMCRTFQPPRAILKNSVFVRSTERFILRDDFEIIPLSTSSTFTVLQQFDIKNAASLERKRVDVRKDEVLRLLKLTLLSKSPLSDAFLMKSKSNISVAADHKFIGLNLVKTESDCNPADNIDLKSSHMKLFYSVLSNKFLHAEVGDDLADLLFGFLAFPLGSIVKILNKDTSLGCVDNLYKSVEQLDTGDVIISERVKEMLSAPKLFPHYSCHGALVKTDEVSPISYLGRKIIYPKSSDLVVGKGGFAKHLAKFVVSDDMVVTPFSLFSFIEIYWRHGEQLVVWQR